METQAPAAPVRRRRGTYAKTEDTRHRILEAALEVFSESGYRSGSLRDVAARVGMSEAGLLHHYANKSSLLQAVLDLRDERAFDLVPVDPEDGEATIRGLLALARYNASVPGVVELYSTLSAEATSPDHPAHEYFTLRYTRTRNMIEAAFEDLARRGRLTPGVSPRGAAIATIALMDGLQVQWLLDRSALDMADSLEAFLHKVVDFD